MDLKRKLMGSVLYMTFRNAHDVTINVREKEMSWSCQIAFFGVYKIPINRLTMTAIDAMTDLSCLFHSIPVAFVEPLS